MKWLDAWIAKCESDKEETIFNLTKPESEPAVSATDPYAETNAISDARLLLSCNGFRIIPPDHLSTEADDEKVADAVAVLSDRGYTVSHPDDDDDGDTEELETAIVEYIEDAVEEVLADRFPMDPGRENLQFSFETPEGTASIRAGMIEAIEDDEPDEDDEDAVATSTIYLAWTGENFESTEPAAVLTARLNTLLGG